MKKLIRDKYIDIIKDEDVKLYYINDVTSNNDDERNKLKKTYLFEKLSEEIEELKTAADKDNIAEELCDVMTVLHRIIKFYNINSKRINLLVEDKETRLGGFDDFLIMEKEDG